ncbi:DUF1206 domain-containing protein [Acrocarpospora macrocephala]|uniref:Membrane protein n=1 Tax=Acrocarpospora macrocephala TaxID=150177 RepID=A0A5M3WXM8_9ACTN|nr:DUF1206 domain-containing protein [Acrocarpospora macrocephala]GES14225.1 membrane protein [Acrocarpospora macrocephala]
MVSTSPTRIARRVAEHPILERAAKIGFAARGVLYGLIGLVALQIGLGNGVSTEADKSGAIHLVASRPLGGLLLWIMAFGLAGLALWQTGEMIFGSHEPLDRVEAAGQVVVYVVLVVSLLGLLLSGKNASSTDEQSQDVTRLLFELPAGQLLVVLLGLGVVALGVYSIREGLTERFMRHMTVTVSRARATVVKLGKAGYVARGAIAVAAGGLICQAALTYDPEKAVGIDGALKALADTPVGPWLLVVVASGVVLFAVYCFAEARWHRT